MQADRVPSLAEVATSLVSLPGLKYKAALGSACRAHLCLSMVAHL